MIDVWDGQTQEARPAAEGGAGGDAGGRSPTASSLCGLIDRCARECASRGDWSIDVLG